VVEAAGDNPPDEAALQITLRDVQASASRAGGPVAVRA